MTRLTITLATAAGLLALSAAAAADPVPQTLSSTDFNGVWAPERRGARSGSGRGFAPSDAAGRKAPDGATFRLGGPPGDGPAFGPRSPGPGGPVEISAEDQAKGLDHGDIRVRNQMTEEGKAKFAAFDPLQHPASNCMTPGLPSIAMIPELQEWKIGAKDVIIRHEGFNTLRVVHLDQSAHPDEPHTALGHAFGKVDGIELIIETGNLNEEWGGLGRNAPGSDARTVRETYRLIDKDTIGGEILISDPKFLTRPSRLPVTLKRQPAGTEIVDFPCDVEVSQRDYRYIRDGIGK